VQLVPRERERGNGTRSTFLTYFSKYRIVSDIPELFSNYFIPESAPKTSEMSGPPEFIAITAPTGLPHGENTACQLPSLNKRHGYSRMATRARVGRSGIGVLDQTTRDIPDIALSRWHFSISFQPPFFAARLPRDRAFARITASLIPPQEIPPIGSGSTAKVARRIADTALSRYTFVIRRPSSANEEREREAVIFLAIPVNT